MLGEAWANNVEVYSILIDFKQAYDSIDTNSTYIDTIRYYTNYLCMYTIQTDTPHKGHIEIY